MLLLAVQQTASNLSPVVFDQFLRRKANQAFVGFFIGLVLFSYVVMAAVKDPTPPILGAAFATVLTVVALFISGGQYQTLTKRMFTSLRDEIDPTIAAISALLTGGSFVAVLLIAISRPKKNA